MEQTSRSPRIGDLLVQLQLVTPAQVDEAMELAAAQGVRLGEALVRLGHLDADRLAWVLGAQFDLSQVDLTAEMVDWEWLSRLPIARLRVLRLLPLTRVAGEVTAVVADPTNAEIGATLRELFPLDAVTVQLASEEAIVEFLDRADSATRHTPIFGGEVTPQLLFGMIDEGTTRQLALWHTGRGREVIAFADSRPLAVEQTMSADAFANMGRRVLAECALSSCLMNASIGIRTASPGMGSRPARVTTMNGVQGGWLSIALLSHAPPPRAPADATTVVAAADMAAVKRGFLNKLAELSGQREPGTPIAGVSLESRIDFHEEGILQVEVHSDELRARLAAELCCLHCVRTVIAESDESAAQSHRPPFRSTLVREGARMIVLKQGESDACGNCVFIGGRPDEIDSAVKRVLEGCQ